MYCPTQPPSGAMVEHPYFMEKLKTKLSENISELWSSITDDLIPSFYSIFLKKLGCSKIAPQNLFFKKLFFSILKCLNMFVYL